MGSYIQLARDMTKKKEEEKRPPFGIDVRGHDSDAPCLSNDFFRASKHKKHLPFAHLIKTEQE